jgi:flagellin-like hook-associated protein FlgL
MNNKNHFYYGGKMAGLNPISGTKEALLGMIQRKRKESKQGGVAGLIQEKRFADLFSQVAKTKKRNQFTINPGEMAIADRLELSSNVNRIGSNNAANSAIRFDVADAALGNSREVMNRLTELSAMATNPMLNSQDRQALDVEAQQLKAELGRIQSGSTFNGQPLLQGSSTSTFTGEGTVSSTDADLSQVVSDVSSIDLTTLSGANSALSSLGDASTSLSQERAKVGSAYNELTRASDFAMTVANEKSIAAEGIRTNSLGEIGSMFGPELAGVVNELLGMSF